MLGMSKLVFDKPVGRNMKGILLPKGRIVSWEIDPSTGTPHHDDIYGFEAIAYLINTDLENGSRIIGVHSGGIENEPEYTLDVNAILVMFSDYMLSDPIEIFLNFVEWQSNIKTFGEFISKHPMPQPSRASEFEAWCRLATRTSREMRPSQERLRPDLRELGHLAKPWQEKDEDWSKGFSVRNPRRR